MNRWSSFIDEIAQLFAGNSHMGIWIKAAIAVLLGLMGWLVVKAFLYAARKKLASSQLIQSNKQLLKMIRNALAYTIMLFVGMYLVHIFQLQMLQKLLPALFVVLLARPMSIFLLVCLKYLEQSWADKTETKVDNIIFDLLNRFSGVIIYAVAVVLSLDILGNQCHAVHCRRRRPRCGRGLCRKRHSVQSDCRYTAYYRSAIRSRRSDRGMECAGEQRDLGGCHRHRASGDKNQKPLTILLSSFRTMKS